MRKLERLIIIALLFVAVLCVFTACGNSYNVPADTSEPKQYSLEFIAWEGGYIEGKAMQTVREGDDSEKVTAIADTGYYFVGWLDDDVPSTNEKITRRERVVYNVDDDRTYIAKFDKITFKVSYTADNNGYLAGMILQNIKYGENGTEVTAIPKTGYRFTEWSDGKKDPTRKEIELIANTEITANFELITNTYKFEYKFADGNCDDEEVSLTYGNLKETRLPVPEREHCRFGGWYADRYLTRQISDKTGFITIGNELFYSDCDRFYAKWISENTNPYRILIIT